MLSSRMRFSRPLLSSPARLAAASRPALRIQSRESQPFVIVPRSDVTARLGFATTSFRPSGKAGKHNGDIDKHVGHNHSAAVSTIIPKPKEQVEPLDASKAPSAFSQSASANLDSNKASEKDRGNTSGYWQRVKRWFWELEEFARGEGPVARRLKQKSSTWSIWLMLPFALLAGAFALFCRALEVLSIAAVLGPGAEADISVQTQFMHSFRTISRLLTSVVVLAAIWKLPFYAGPVPFVGAVFVLMLQGWPWPWNAQRISPWEFVKREITKHREALNGTELAKAKERAIQEKRRDENVTKMALILASLATGIPLRAAIEQGTVEYPPSSGGEGESPAQKSRVP